MLVNLFIKCYSNIEWISIGYEKAITKTPLFLNYKAMVIHNHLSFIKEVQNV